MQRKYLSCRDDAIVAACVHVTDVEAIGMSGGGDAGRMQWLKGSALARRMAHRNVRAGGNVGQLGELLVLIAGLAISSAVHAHVGLHTHGSFSAGLLHPFTGVDHLLAMVTVGLWAARSGTRSWWTLPSVFVLAMAVGAGFGTLGGPLALAENGTAISVLILGCLVAFAAQVRWQWAVPIMAAFALCHGYVHGAEMPEFADPWGYFIGFLLATVSLHAFGVLTAFLLRDRMVVLRAAGVAISIAGAWLVIAA